VVQATNRAESTPAVRDPEVDKALEWLDKAARALVEADVAAAKSARTEADAALVLARYKRSGEIHRKAVEVKLRAEARLGQLAGPALEGKDRTAAATAARAGATVSPAETRSALLVDLDRQDIAKCRKVWGASEHLNAYLDHVAKAGEEPTRSGFLSFAAAQEDARQKARAESAADSAPRVIDTTAIVTAPRMNDAGSAAKTPAPPKGAPPRAPTPLPVRPVRAVGARWVAALRRCIGEVEQARPSPGWFEKAHGDLLSSLRSLESNCEAFVGEEEETLRGRTA
jgi:hypothetical protein